jgi:hypothetical protein
MRSRKVVPQPYDNVCKMDKLVLIEILVGFSFFNKDALLLKK